jgi:type VI protein secretion system component VasK
MGIWSQRRRAHRVEDMHHETDVAYAIAAIVCAFLGAATGILTKRGMALTLTAVVLSHAPDWKRGLAWALVAAIWYAIVWLVCTDRRTRRNESKIGEQQRSPAVCPNTSADATGVSIGR